MDDAISFHAIFEKAATTVDGGWRISFSIPQSESFNVQRLSALRDLGLMLVVMPESMTQSDDNKLNGNSLHVQTG